MAKMTPEQNCTCTWTTIQQTRVIVSGPDPGLRRRIDEAGF